MYIYIYLLSISKKYIPRRDINVLPISEKYTPGKE